MDISKTDITISFLLLLEFPRSPFYLLRNVAICHLAAHTFSLKRASFHHYCTIVEVDKVSLIFPVNINLLKNSTFSKYVHYVSLAISSWRV